MTAGNPGPVVPERYLAALGSEDALKTMKKAPKRVARLIEKLSSKKLQRRPEAGKWSIHEVLAHLADGEVVLGARLRIVAAHERPRIPAYDQDAFVARLGVGRAKTSELLEDFAAVRAANLRLLARLPAEAWAKIGVHEERGEESVETMVRMYAGHDLLHLQQIERLIAELEGEKRAAKAEKESERHAARLERETLRARRKEEAAARKRLEKSRKAAEQDRRGEKRSKTEKQARKAPADEARPKSAAPAGAPKG